MLRSGVGPRPAPPIPPAGVDVDTAAGCAMGHGDTSAAWLLLLGLGLVAGRRRR